MQVGDITPRNLGPRKTQNTNILGPRNPRSQDETDAIADRLVAAFKSPAHRNLFLRVAWRFSEEDIWRLAERALNSGYNSPRAYFIKAVKRDNRYYDS